MLYKDVVLPPSVPLDYLSPQKLADALNDSEQRIDSQMARSIILALPNEMNITQEVKLVREFIDQYFIANNMCAVFAIKYPFTSDICERAGNRVSSASRNYADMIVVS